MGTLRLISGYDRFPFPMPAPLFVLDVVKTWVEVDTDGDVFSLFQVEDPLRNRQYFKQAVSSDDYSFTSHVDGKYLYCFSNEGWTSNSKEVSFNVHGIVYVPESEAQDPLDTEGMAENPPFAPQSVGIGTNTSCSSNSPSTLGGFGSG